MKMTQLSCGVVCVLMLLALGCTDGRRDTAAAQSDAVVVPLTGLDPVALTQGKEMKGRDELFVLRRGYKYLFATAGNKRLFEASPARYEIQGNGNCVVMPGVKADPNVFSAHKGRIYTFGSPMCVERFKASPERFISPETTATTPTKVRNVAIFLHQGVELLDFAGPGEVFAAARTIGGQQAFNTYTVAATAEPLLSQGFVTIKPQYTIENCPRPDIIVLSGGNIDRPLQDPKVLEWIAKTSQTSEVTMSVCTGAFLLAKAGLLDGREATTHWAAIDRLRQAAPKVKVIEHRRFVDQGRILTSAGVSAGIDGALRVVERLLGRPAATLTAKHMEYDWQPEKNVSR